MSDPETSDVDIKPVDASVEQQKAGVLSALAKRFIEQLYFRNVLAVAMVFTMCWRELQGLPMSEHFYMLAALVVGMYFPSGEAKR